MIGHGWLFVGVTHDACTGVTLPNPLRDDLQGRDVTQIVATHDDDPRLHLVDELTQGLGLGGDGGLQLDDVAAVLTVKIELLGDLTDSRYRAR